MAGRCGDAIHISPFESQMLGTRALKVQGIIDAYCGNLDDASGSLNAVLLHQPQDPMALAFAGAVRWSSGQQEEAVRMWRNIPEMGVSIAEMGISAYYEHDLGTAAKWFDLAKQIDNSPAPWSAWVHYIACITYSGNERPNDALSQCNYRLLLQPDAEGYFRLGTVYLELGNPQAALPFFKQAVDLAPRNTMMNLYLGLAFLKEGFHKEAIEPLHVALESDNEWVRESARRFLDMIIGTLQ